MSSKRAVLVVGGGSGIGLKAIEYLLSRTDCRIVCFSFNFAPDCAALQEAHPDRIWLHGGDVTQIEDLKFAISLSLEKMGAIDSLLYCAGMLYVQRCAEVDMEMVKKSFEVNVFGAMAACQLALPHLRSSLRRARVVILSSGADHLILNCGWMPYSSSKAALTRFLQGFAHEENGGAVKIQGVYPRVTRTPMTTDMVTGQYRGIMRDDEIETFLRWEREGGKIEPPDWCGNVVGMLAADVLEGGDHGLVQYYDLIAPASVYKTGVELGNEGRLEPELVRSML